MSNWYVLHTRTSAEHFVASKLEENDIETFLPEISKKGSTGREKTIALFPGYLFVHIDYMKANPDHWRWTPGVRYLVAFGEYPIPVPPEVIAALKQRVAVLNQRSKRPQAKFSPGDQVRIKDGPFKEMLAIFDGPVDPAEWVHVLLQTMNRSMRMRVAASALEKVEQEKKNNQKRPRRTRGKGRHIRSS
ncbi:MAG: transcription termination/antitermination NusG family protein [Anaerolineae bacterium]|nr:transcription termination/antitermination NusG family protein [Anaerolineae bacterium]